MSYEVYYKKEKNGKITITVNNEKIKTPLVSESVAELLCEDISNYLDNFNEDDYFFEIQLSDEQEPLGIIVDIWQDGEVESIHDISEEEPYDTITFLFDDYSIDVFYDDGENLDYDDFYNDNYE